MIYINLLPVRKIKQRARARSQLISFAAILLCLLGILGILWMLQNGQVKRLEQNRTALEQEKKKYETVLTEIKKLDSDKELVEKKTKIIENLHASSSLTVHLMDAIARQVPPDRMWLTSVSQSGGSLQIEGMALDNQTIAGFMDDLRKSSYVQEVELNTASLQAYADRSLKSFSLNCNVGTPNQEKAAEPETKK